VYIGSDPGRARDAIAATTLQMRRLCEEPVEEGELRRAREYYKGRLLLHLEGTNSLATWLGGQELLTDQIQSAEEIIESIESVSAEDVTRLARTTFADHPLQMAVVGPFH